MAIKIILLFLVGSGAAIATTNANATINSRGAVVHSSSHSEMTPSSKSSTPQAGNQSSDTSITLSCWGWAPSCLASTNTRPTFALLGDSITAFGFNSDGWATKLASAYLGSVNMLNYGVEGATTRRVDEVADKLLQQLGPHIQQVHLAVIWFGANDAVTPRAPKWHLPVPQYKENLARLVARLRGNGVADILLITPPPVGRRGDRNNAATALYAAAVKELAVELQLQSLDIYSSIMAVDKWQEACLDKDQLHLSPAGQEVVYNSLLKVLLNSTHLSPARLAATAAVGVQQPLQQQPQLEAAGSSGGTGGALAMQVVLCAAVMLLFVAIVTEAQRVPPAATSKKGSV